jgi:hypothetical protein
VRRVPTIGLLAGDAIHNLRVARPRRLGIHYRAPAVPARAARPCQLFVAQGWLPGPGEPYQLAA